MAVTGVLLMAARDWTDWGKGWLLAKVTTFLLLTASALWFAKPSTERLNATLTALTRGSTDRRAAVAAVRESSRICAVECLLLAALVATSAMAQG